MNSAFFYNRLLKCTSAIQRRGGKGPPPDPVLQAFVAAYIWETGFLGVDTGDKAAVLTGLPRTLVEYARFILESGDQALIDAVMAKTVSLRKAFLAVHRGVKLVDAYTAAAPPNKAHLGQTVGPDTVWDEVVIPALGPTIDPVVTIPIAAREVPTPTPNGKTNGNGTGQRIVWPDYAARNSAH